MFWEYKDVMVKTWRKFLKYFIDYVKRYKITLTEELVNQKTKRELKRMK
jgi:hypothetical protein